MAARKLSMEVHMDRTIKDETLKRREQVRDSMEEERESPSLGL